MTAAPLEHLALNVYRWDDGAQNRLLADCLAPAVRALQDAGRVRRFWHQRFDARGPHLFVLLGVPAGQAGSVRAELSARLDAYLAADPCTAVLDEETLRARHDGCRGATMCAMDALPGFGASDEYLFGEHPADGYPLNLTAEAGDEDALWRMMSHVALWAIGELGAGEGAGPAMRWVAAMDHALRDAGGDARAYWRHYACTLRPGLDDRLRKDALATEAALWTSLGDRNRAALAAAWDEAAGSPRSWPHTAELVALVDADDGREPVRRHRLLRALNHAVLGQLGQPVRLRTPLAVYAWLRTRPPANAS